MDERDEELALAAARGSVIAFGELARRYERRVYSFLRRRCRNQHDLEDLTQTTFVEAWSSIGRYSPNWLFSTWLFTIASRQLTGWFRRSAVHDKAMRSISGRPRDGRDDAANHAMHVEEREGIWAIAEATLDAVQLTALWLRYAEGCSIADVARIMGRSPVTTRVILFRARQALAAAIEPTSAGATSNGRITLRRAPCSLHRAPSRDTGGLVHGVA